jgi:hypothetical protein
VLFLVFFPTWLFGGNSHDKFSGWNEHELHADAVCENFFYSKIYHHIPTASNTATPANTPNLIAFLFL